MNTVLCAGCATPVAAGRSYCSKSCARRFRPPTVKPCGQCGRSMSSTSPIRKYCSIECLQAARHDRDELRHGLSRRERKALTAAHASCDVCAGVERLTVDHDHSDGRIRGVLCSGCNLALGAVQDDPARLLALAAYLERFIADPTLQGAFVQRTLAIASN